MAQALVSLHYPAAHATALKLWALSAASERHWDVQRENEEKLDTQEIELPFWHDNAGEQAGAG